MLTKLISYELKSVARHFIPIYGLILAVSTILGLYFHTLPIVEWVGGIGGGLLFGLLIAILVSLRTLCHHHYYDYQAIQF